MLLILLLGITDFILVHKINLLHLRRNLGKQVINAKMFLNPSNLFFVIKQGVFRLLIVFLAKVDMLFIHFLIFLKGYCLLQLKGQSPLSKTFCENSNHDDSGVSFPDFPSRINLKLHDIPVNSHNSYQVHKWSDLKWLILPMSLRRTNSLNLLIYLPL